MSFVVTSLHNACKQNDVEAVKILLESGNVDVNKKGKDDQTPLHVACTLKKHHIAELLLKYGADVNAVEKVNECTPLHSACSTGAYSTVSLLIRNNANLEARDKNGLIPLHYCVKQYVTMRDELEEREKNQNTFKLFRMVYVSGIITLPEISKQILLALFQTHADPRMRILMESAEKFLGRKEIDFSNVELPNFQPYCALPRLQILNLSHNHLKEFPQLVTMHATRLVSLDVSYNNITEIPEEIESLTTLTSLNASNNKLESIPAALSNIAEVDISKNPLSCVPMLFREDNQRLTFYVKYGAKKEPWNQVKLMLVGHEGVGKTTLLRRLQGNKTKQNISTNGVDIAKVELSHGETKVFLNVWDFGGQEVFHSTHRFFLTSSAMYLIVYDMSDDKTHARLHELRHWMQQIASIIDLPGNSMPILVVGTHADKLSKAEQQAVLAKMAHLYPVSRNPNTGIQGHYAISLSAMTDTGIKELKHALMDIATTHPKIGVGKVVVPSFLIIVKDYLEKRKMYQKYMKFEEYVEVCREAIITDDFPIVEWTLILQELGVLVWNNTPKLRSIVIIDPQWLADALAGVVTMVNQSAIARTGGITSKKKLTQFMLHKIEDTAVHPIVFGLLERFEIILRMRSYFEGRGDKKEAKEDDIKYFVPSLLYAFDPKTSAAQISLQFWKRLCAKSGYKLLRRRFTWSFYPASFFPRLLLRLMHLRVSILASWVDAAVLMSQDQSQFSFLRLCNNETDEGFSLEVSVLQEEGFAGATSKFSHSHTREALISELAYTITRLDRDMWKEECPPKHEVILKSKTGDEEEVSVTFEDCVGMAEKDDSIGAKFLSVSSSKIHLDEIVPDLSGCNVIVKDKLTDWKMIGEGGFGTVYKANYDYSFNGPTPVAIKEMKKSGDDEIGSELKKLYEFQHEMLIMSKIQHPNLVRLHGILKNPLSLVLEFIPCGDLHHVLIDAEKSSKLNLKWRLKMSLDIANGMGHLHMQNPPLCHSDLRAPNIFVASLDPETDIVGKVADFGLAQQVFPFSTTILGNLTETAPETWGDEGGTKGAMYDERSDVFSFAIIMWRLFGTQTDPEDGPYAYLKDEKGRPLKTWTLRQKIREGARPLIPKECKESIRQLIEACWRFDPTTRPFFPYIIERLRAIYLEEFGPNEKHAAQFVPHSPTARINRTNNITRQTFSASKYTEEDWRPNPQIPATNNWGVQSLLVIDGEIWAGTNTGAILIVSAKTGQFVQLVTLQATGRIYLLQGGPSCVWVSGESEKVYIVHTRTKYKIAEIDNEAPVTCMTLSLHNYQGTAAPVVWIADTQGCVSLYDLINLQKYCRFRILEKINPPPPIKRMSAVQQNIWMAVGPDIVVVDGQTLQVIVQHPAEKPRSRINDIASARGNLVWTCSKDGWVRVWKLRRVGAEAHLEAIAKKQVESEVKFLQPVMFSPIYQMCTGDFNGEITLWNSETMDTPKKFPMPPETKNHAIQCALDAIDCGFWIGTMNKENPVLRYNTTKSNDGWLSPRPRSVVQYPVFMSSSPNNVASIPNTY